MEYLRTDPETGYHLSRCYAEDCSLKSLGTKAITHCDTEIWEDPESSLRVLGPLPRFTDRWKWLYKLRMSIERIFRSLKHSRGLQGHCVQDLAFPVGEAGKVSGSPENVNESGCHMARPVPELDPARLSSTDRGP